MLLTCQRDAGPAALYVLVAAVQRLLPIQIAVIRVGFSIYRELSQPQVASLPAAMQADAGKNR